LYRILLSYHLNVARKEKDKKKQPGGKTDSLRRRIKRLKEKQKMQKTTEEGKTSSSVDA